MNPLYNILSYLAVIFNFVPFFLGFFTWKFFSKHEKIIFAVIILSVITETCGFFAEDLLKSYRILIINVYTILEGIIICYYYDSLLKNKNLRWLIILTGLCFIIISTYQIFVTKKTDINHVSFTIESILITLLSIITFNNLLRNPVYSNILSAPVFWINCSFLLFFSGNLFLHLFSRFLQEHSLVAFYELWGLWHSTLNIILYTLISIGFWKTRTLQR